MSSVELMRRSRNLSDTKVRYSAVTILRHWRHKNLERDALDEDRETASNAESYEQADLVPIFRALWNRFPAF